MTKYPKPHVVQIKPGIVVDLTTEEAIKLIQELFRAVYGETPVPSTPPQPISDIVKKFEEENEHIVIPLQEPKWPKLPKSPLDIWCEASLINLCDRYSFSDHHGTH